MNTRKHIDLLNHLTATFADVYYFYFYYWFTQTGGQHLRVVH